jgi:RES domain-containing protein
VITAWRIVAAQHAEDAFSGDGARRYKGRWHSAGSRVVYTCESISLATLELLVRAPRAQLLPAYAIISCSFPEAIVEELDRGLLPRNWRDYPPPSLLQELGNRWIRSRASAGLAVPSAVTPQETNYLLNPEHDDFGSVEIGDPRPFHLDLRLLT